MYHGTHRDRGNKILHNNAMEYSKGDYEWLGDGIYLYRDKMLAFRWIVIQYKNKYNPKTIAEDLLKEYMILKVEISYDYERLFSLLNPTHKIEFDRVKEYCLKNVDSFKELKEGQIVDGAVINYMFNNLEYGKDFDVVEAFFTIENNKYAFNTRLRMLGELQICVKNEDTILSIKDATDEVSYAELKESLDSFNKYRSSYKDNSSRYSKRRKGGFYE